MIDLSEIFLSIQGESTFTGLPCIFIRFAGCNLRCSFCDTTYSYRKSYSLTINEILQKTAEFEPVKLVEITGGEPLLQSEIYPLFELLNANCYRILLETNGSVNLAKVPQYVTKIVDVKCPGSKHEDSFLIRNLQYLNPHDQLKFVLTDYEDFCFAKSFLDKHSITAVNVLFSPVGEKLPPKTLAEWILKERLSVRLQLQMHKVLNME